MQNNQIEARRLSLDEERLDFEKHKLAKESKLAVWKLFLTILISLLASAGIPWLIARQNVTMERLKLNAASVEHVQAVLDPKLEPDARRRIYEYLVNAFEGTPLHEWANKGLKESVGELKKAREERDEALQTIGDLRRERNEARALVRNLERELLAGGKGQHKAELEEQLHTAKAKLSEVREELAELLIVASAPASTPAGLNTTGLRLWKQGEYMRSTAMFEEACKSEYLPACFNLAGILFRGDLKDWERSERLYRKVCEQRRGRACKELGDLLMAQARTSEGLEFYAQGCELNEKRACEELKKNR